jgi:hypothetical protein
MPKAIKTSKASKLGLFPGIPVEDTNRELRVEFETLWQAWHHDRHQKKKSSMNKFLRIRKKGVPFDTILNAAQAFIGQEASRGTKPEFIPHLVTWLNQARYNDELPKPRTHSGLSRSVSKAEQAAFQRDLANQRQRYERKKDTLSDEDLLRLYAAAKKRLSPHERFNFNRVDDAAYGLWQADSELSFLDEPDPRPGG